MFLLVGILWVGLGSIPLIQAIRKRSEPGGRRRIVRGIVVLVVDLLVLVAVNVYFALATEFWWFAAMGYGRRFWTEYTARLVLYLCGAAVGAIAFAAGLRAAIGQEQRLARRLAAIGGALTGGLVLGLSANSLWQPLLMYANRVVSGVPDPVFGLDTSFYLFSLPLAGAVHGRLLSALTVYLIALALLVIAVEPAVRQGRGVFALLARRRRLRREVAGIGGLFLLLLAAGRVLALPGLMYDRSGAVTGVGWLEANVLIPAHIVAAVVLLAAAIVVLWATVDERPLLRLLAIRKMGTDASSGAPAAPGQDASAADDAEHDAEPRSPDQDDELRLTSRSWVAPAVVVAGLFLVSSAVPGLVRMLVVDPNEITLESAYIPNHVDSTREAFGIDSGNVSETRYPAGRNVTAEVIEANRATLDNVRLWDWRALQDNLEQQQEIRLYYEFHDVDIDRYQFDGEVRQMMLSVRELEKSNLAAESRTWVSRHFKYTHGYGLAAVPVNGFRAQGGPDLTVSNIPPTSDVARFEVTRPEVYYGERTNDHVYVRTTQQEFDYPAGDENVYSDYEGAGGVPLGGAARRLAYAWRVDGYRQLFSSYLTRESRIMFRRNIVERVSTLAPFLTYDRDPYPVLTTDGRIVYIVDAYTTSRAYPYSEPYAGMIDTFRGVNYIRNSVKVVIDAYDGTVDFYVVTPDDPIVATFDRIFPELFSPIADMPRELKDHIRYPADLLTVQAEMYSVYHMTDTQVFYQREDVWEFATERYRAAFQPVEPYYVMLQYPERTRVEFVLMLPFTPSNKNVMNAWMAGRSDYEHYGELTVYTLPKGIEVLGPRQIEARIDQNTEMSRALSLWGQRGSEVIRGNLLAIPLFADEQLHILFVEPIYLQAEEASLPQMQRVVLADQDLVVWDSSFETGLDRLLGRLPPTPGSVEPVAPDGDDGDEPAEPATAAQAPARSPQPAGAAAGPLAARARQALSDYQRAVSDGRFQDAGAALDRLERILSESGEVSDQADTTGG